MPNRQSAFRLINIALLLCLAAIYVWHSLNRLADADEFQTLTNAFDSARGLTIYRDYWDNHGPLATWIFVPALKLWHGGHELITWLRGLMLLPTALIAGMTFWLGRRIFPDSPQARWIAIIFLLTTPPFFAKTIEFRGDNPAHLLYVLALCLVTAGLQRPRTWLFFCAGLALGLIAGFTVKATIMAVGIALYAGVWLLLKRQRTSWKPIAAIAVGGILPVALFAAILWMRNLWEPFVLCYFKANSSRGFAGFTSSEFTEILKKSPVWGFLMLSIVIANLVSLFRRRLQAEQAAMLAITLFMSAQFLLLLPTKNMQSLLPACVPMALLAGATGELWLRRLQNRLSNGAGSAVAVQLVIVTGMIWGMARYDHLDNRELPRQVAFANRVADIARKEPAVFDPSGRVFLLPKPGQFHVIVTFLRDMYRDGEIDLYISEMLAIQQIRTVVFDKRTAELRPGDLLYFHLNFSPVDEGPDCLLLRSNSSIADQPTVRPGKELDMWQHQEEGKKQPGRAIGEAGWFKDYMKLVK